MVFVNKGYISLFLVLSITLGISVSLYNFFEQNEYIIFLKKEEVQHESKRLITRICLNMLEERVYAGLTEDELQNISISKTVYGNMMSCSVTDAYIEIQGAHLVYKATLQTPFGLKYVTYTFKPGGITRIVNSS